MVELCKIVLDCFSKRKIIDSSVLHQNNVRNSDNFKDLDSVCLGAKVLEYMLYIHDHELSSEQFYIL